MVLEDGATTLNRTIPYGVDDAIKELMQSDIFGDTKDYEKARELYERASEMGYSNAMVYLGLLYQNGNGVPKDYEMAVDWYRKAAGQGNAIAQYYLGNCYYNGQGVEKDFAKAVERAEVCCKNSVMVP